MTRGARVAAPAKVNFFLRILGRRPDGFHEVETVFQSIDLHDDVSVELRDRGLSLDVDGGGDLGPTEQNLAYRAAAAYMETRASGGGRPLQSGVRVRLTKRIPAGAGLGGGSSDAAAVLRCLDHLTGASIPADALHRIAASLGSDVPFFLSGPRAVGRGRGERLEFGPPLPPAHLVLALPPVHVATSQAYAAFAAARAASAPTPVVSATTPVVSDAGPRIASLPGSWDEMWERTHNDFEAQVAGAHPPVARALEVLRALGAEPALLSGSGAACFGRVTDLAAAESIAEEAERALGFRCMRVATLEAPPPIEEV